MKKYTAPKLEVVTFQIADVITTSGNLPQTMSLNIKDLGTAGALSDHVIG